jgi:hypothetical protein
MTSCWVVEMVISGSLIVEVAPEDAGGVFCDIAEALVDSSGADVVAVPVAVAVGSVGVSRPGCRGHSGSTR